MVLCDETVTIKAPPDIVWSQVRRLIGRRPVSIEIPYRLLVFTSSALIKRFSSVFMITPLPTGSTRLRCVLDRVEKIDAAFASHAEPDAALDVLSFPTTTPAQEGLRAVGAGVLEVLPGSLAWNFISALEETVGRLWITGIKRRAERTARKTGWLPKPDALERAALRLPHAKAPWDPKKFPGMAALGSFAGAGILAGINWHRLGKPQWVWPTILPSVIGFLVLWWILLSVSEEASLFIGYGIFLPCNIALGALLTYCQLPAYRQWVSTHGEAAAKQTGFLIPLAVWLGIAAFAFGTLLLLEVL